MRTRTSAFLSAGARGVLLAAGLGVVAVTYWRLWYGIDLTDESFYVAVSYRFAMGARPFVDETTVTQQTTAILLYPFVRAYDAIAGLTGIVLFLRHLQFALSLAVGAAIYRTLRLFLDRTRSLAIALGGVVFVPFAVHSISYDSVGCALLTAGCFLGVRPLLDAGAHAARLLSAACLGLAAFAYPPLLVPVGVCVGIRVGLARGHRLREALGHGVPALGLPLAGLGALAADVGLSTVVGDYRHSSQFLGQAGGAKKLREIADGVRAATPHWYLLLGALVLLAGLWRYRRSLALVVLLALPFLVLPSQLSHFNTSLDFVARLGWLAAPLFVIVRRRTGARLLMLVVWTPGFVAGAITAYSSSNGAVNFGVGGFPTAIVATVFLVWAVEDAMPAARMRWLAVVPAIAVLALLVWSDTVPVYRDGSLSTLSATMRSGPYAGLATSPWKRRWIDRLTSDLSRYRSPCTILFFDNFPAGYLLTKARPDTNGVWTATVSPALVRAYQDQLLGYYRGHGNPDVVVEMRRIPYTHHQGWTVYYRTDWPLVAAVDSSPYRLVRWRRPYSIYQAGGSTCGRIMGKPPTRLRRRRSGARP